MQLYFPLQCCMVRKLVPVICQLLESLHLQLSPGKCQAFTFAKPRPLHSRNPVSYANGISVHHVSYFQLLGITIDKHQNQLAHVYHLKLKFIAYSRKLLKMTAKAWVLAILYLKLYTITTIVDKIITYDPRIWEGHLTKQAISKLISLQLMFLL